MIETDFELVRAEKDQPAAHSCDHYQEPAMKFVSCVLPLQVLAVFREEQLSVKAIILICEI